MGSVSLRSAAPFLTLPRRLRPSWALTGHSWHRLKRVCGRGSDHRFVHHLMPSDQPEVRPPFARRAECADGEDWGVQRDLIWAVSRGLASILLVLNTGFNFLYTMDLLLPPVNLQ